MPTRDPEHGGAMNWRFHWTLYHLATALASPDDRGNYGHVNAFVRMQVSLAGGKERRSVNISNGRLLPGGRSREGGGSARNPYRANTEVSASEPSPSGVSRRHTPATPLFLRTL